MRGEGALLFAFMVQMNHLCRCGRPAEAPPATSKPKECGFGLRVVPQLQKPARIELLVGQWPNKAMLTLLKKLGI